MASQGKAVGQEPLVSVTNDMPATEKTRLLGEPATIQVEGAAIEETPTSTSDAGSKRWTRHQTMVAVALSLQNIALCISFGIISPFYPSEAEKKGATKTEVGLVFGIFQLVMFLVSPIYGNYIHKIGAKFMFLAGSFLLGGCSIAFGLLEYCPDGVVYVVMCFISRSIEANGCAMVSTASFAIMAKTFPDDVGKALGILETFSGIGMVLGPSIGGGLYSLGGYKLPFIVVGGIAWVITVAGYFILPSIDDMAKLESSILKLLKIPGCLVIYFVIIACAIALSFLDPTFSPFMQKEFPSLTIAQIGLLFMIAPGVYAISAPLGGFISDKGWLGTSALLGLTVCGVSFLFLGPSPIFNHTVPNTLAEICIALAFMGLSIGFGLIPVFPLIIRLAKNAGFDDGIQTLGIVSGYFNSGFSLGGFVGPTVAGALNQKYGFPISSSICAAILLLTALIFAIYVLVMFIGGKWPISVPDSEGEDPLTGTDTQNGSIQVPSPSANYSSMASA